MSRRLVLLYAVSLCLLLNFLIPPFQNPDEPQHFGAVLRYALGEGREPEIEEQIIRLMDRYDWWRLAGMGRPTPLPARFSDIPFLNFTSPELATGHLVLYHAAVGSLLRLIPTSDFVVLYAISRMISALLFCGTLLLLRSAFSRVAEGAGRTAGLGLFFVLFLPQFCVLAVSVNPEAAAIFWGALFFTALVSWMSRQSRALALAGLPLAALAGFLTDRAVFYLVPLAAILPIFYIRRGRPLRSLGVAGLALLLALAVASWAAWFFPAQVFSGLMSVQDFVLGGAARMGALHSGAGLAGLSPLRFVDSFWLRFGWMAFSAAVIFYYALRAAAVLSLAGIVVWAARRPARRGPDSPVSPLAPWAVKLVAISAAALGIQIFAILRTAVAAGVPPQGRYLFPVIFPLAFLFVIGLESLGGLLGRRAGRVAVVVFILFELFFFVFALWNDIAPVFHLTLTAPHPGL